MDLDNWVVAYLLKGFILLALWVVVIYPITALFTRYFPDGKVKALLLRRIS